MRRRGGTVSGAVATEDIRTRPQRSPLPPETRSVDSPHHPSRWGPSFDGELETVYRVLLDTSGECLLLLDSEGRIVRASRRASDLLGLGQAGTGFFSDFFIAPSRDALRGWREESAGGSPRESLEATLQAGFKVRVSSRGIASPQGHLLAVLEESTPAPRGEQKSKQVEAELRSVLDSIRAGVLLVDLEGRVRFTNSRFTQMFGLKPRQLDPLEDFDELVHFLASRLRDPQSYSHPWRSFLASADKPGHDEVEIIRPAQRVLERFSRPVLDSEGQRLGWLEVYQDITGLRSTESKMFQKEKMAALGQLVSGIAHELNNPLTAIMGYTQLLLGHGLAATQLDEAKKIYEEAERARRIVKNLLFFARERVQERSSVDLNEVVERTLALRSYELKIESIQVETDLCRNLPRTMADPYQLQQVLLNLLVNAEQALLGSRGKGHIRIRTYRPSDSRIALEVEDDGPGIPQEIASRVFEPFFTTKPPGVGTGLGLSIVYAIVQQHGGDVILDSQRGVGAKIAVELPLVAVPLSEAAAQISQPAVQSRRKTSARILIVEDEPTVAQLITDVLREEGHEPDAVLDSQEGLSRLLRTRYDLVVCDLRMPKLDGQAFYEALVRAGSPIRDRIIFITGDTLAPRTLEFLEPNRLPYLAKPFLVEELKLAVSSMLDRDQKPKSAPMPRARGRTRTVGSRP